MENCVSTSTENYFNRILSVNQRLVALENHIERKMEQVKSKFVELTKMRRAKDMPFILDVQEILQERERNVSKNTESATVQEQITNEAELLPMLLQKKHLYNQTLETFSELKMHMEMMSMKLHEVEGQHIDRGSKWVITPSVQSYSEIPHARSLSADRVLIKKHIKPHTVRSTSLDHSIKQRSNKQEKPSVVKHLRHSTSPSETDINNSTMQQSVGSPWKPQHQCLAVPSPHPLPGVTNEALEYKGSTWHSSPYAVCGSCVEKLKEEVVQLKALHPRWKNQAIYEKLQDELHLILLNAIMDDDAQKIRQLAALSIGRRLLDVPVVDVMKRSLLHFAANYDRVDSAQALLDLGAKLDIEDRTSITPLHIAAFSGHAKMCQLLLGHGAQTKARSTLGQTPLHLAASKGHLQVVRLMVEEWCADMDAKDSTGRTPQNLAELFQKSAVADWLSRQHGAKKKFGQQGPSNSLSANTNSE